MGLTGRPSCEVHGLVGCRSMWYGRFPHVTILHSLTPPQPCTSCPPTPVWAMTASATCADECPRACMLACRSHRALSGRVALPSQSDMQAAVEEEEASQAAAGVPARHHHKLGQHQFDYNARLAAMCGQDACDACLSDWRPRMYAAAGQNRRTCPEMYRDMWPDEDLVREVRSDLDARVDALERLVAHQQQQAAQ